MTAIVTERLTLEPQVAAHADEMFRVFSRQHPAVELMPVGMSSQVAAMIDAVRGSQALPR